MKAVDTNVLVRLLTGDDPKQSAVARELFTTEQIWIAKTVLLEANWVLHSSYDFEDDVIIASFERLIGLDNIHVEDEPSLADGDDLRCITDHRDLVHARKDGCGTGW